MASWTPAMKRNLRSLQTSPTSRRKLRSTDQLLVLACAQVIEQFIDHQQQAVLGECLRELGHHVFEGSLVTCDGPRFRELVLHAKFFEILFQFSYQDVTTGTWWWLRFRCE